MKPKLLVIGSWLLGSTLAGGMLFAAADVQLPADVLASIAAKRAELAKMGPIPTASAPQTAAARGAAINAMPAIATSTNSGNFSVIVRAFQESRQGAGRGSTLVGVSISGAAVPATSFVRQVSVTSATDDTGQSMVPPPLPQGVSRTVPQNMGNLLVGGRAMVAGGASLVTGTLQLSAAARKAKVVKSIDGKAELYAPSEANGSVVVIKDLGAQVGKPIEALSKYGMEVSLVNAASYAAIQPTVPAFANYTPNFATSYILFVKDPQVMLAGYSFTDSNGTVLPQRLGSTRGSLTDGMIIEYGIGGPLPANAQLSLYVAVPESVTSVPFHFENITLP